MVAPVRSREASVAAELQRHYAGYYQGISPRTQMFYGLERLFNIKRLAFGTNGLSATIFGLNRQEWVPVTERLFRQKDHSVASLALLPDADGEVLVQSAQGTYKQVSGFRVWGQVLVLAAMILILASSALGLAASTPELLNAEAKRGGGKRECPGWSWMLQRLFHRLAAD